MNLIFNNPKDLPAPVGGYSQSVEVRNSETLLFHIVFQNLIWTYIRNLLQVSNMGIINLVKVNTYLTHPDQSEINSAVRNKFLGDHRPALTVVVAQTLVSKWLLEIDPIAAV